MSLAWYRKWRPTVFADVIGQDHVVTMLRSALSSGQVSHAILFCGPRGVGKTTMARLLAKSLNCQKLDFKKVLDPCGSCPPCRAFDSGTMIDCIEIDAASNRGIDDIRALRETINLAPIIGKKKVYIIDEVHMLTKEAFNALLKTLEEPPEHVILVLATTENAKIPATIVSRCQRFDFKPLSVEVLAAQITRVAESEGITLDQSSAHIIAEAATGSGRDAISLLQQISLFGAKPTKEQIVSALGFIDDTQTQQLMELLRTDLAETLRHLETWLVHGVDAEQLCRAMLRAFRSGLLSKKAPWAEELSMEQLLRASDEWGWALHQLKGHPEPLVVLAIASHATNQLFTGFNDVTVVSNAKTTTNEIKSGPQAKAHVVEQKDTSTIDVTVSLVQKQWHTNKDQEKLWASLIASVRPHNHGLAALLHDAELLGFETGNPYHITVGVHFPFHKARIQEIKNRTLILEQLKQLTSHDFALDCTLVASGVKPQAPVNNPVTTLEQVEVASTDQNPPESDLVSVAEQLFAGGVE